MHCWDAFGCSLGAIYHNDVCNIYATFTLFIIDGYVLQKRDVCFEGINGKYGEFKLNFPGELFGVKLIHRSGYVGCSAGEKTNWGCNENLSVFVTDEQNKVGEFFKGVIKRI